MNKKAKLNKYISAVIILVLLYLSNLIVGGLLVKILVIGIADLFGEMMVPMILLPGILSSALIYVVCFKTSLIKQMAIPTKKLRTYLMIQGTIMLFIEPVALFIALISTGNTGSGMKEMVVAFSYVWFPVNIIVWVFFVLSLISGEE